MYVFKCNVHIFFNVVFVCTWKGECEWIDERKKRERETEKRKAFKTRDNVYNSTKLLAHPSITTYTIYIYICMYVCVYIVVDDRCSFKKRKQKREKRSRRTDKYYVIVWSVFVCTTFSRLNWTQFDVKHVSKLTTKMNNYQFYSFFFTVHNDEGDDRQ